MIGCTNLLKPAFAQSSVAVLMSHVYTAFLNNTGGRRGVSLWNTARRSEYWRSDVLVFPINLKEEKHWVVATAYIKERRIEVFDSFARYDHYDHIVQVRVKVQFIHI